MKNSLVRHLSEFTMMYELHSHVCTSRTGSAPNIHKNLEFMIVMNGLCNINVMGKSYVVDKGQAVFIMPYRVHNFEITGDGKILDVTFSEELVNTLAKAISTYSPTTPVFTPQKETFDYFCSQMLALFGENSRLCRYISPPSKRIKVKGLLYSLESEFLEQVQLEKNEDYSDTVTHILEYISENFRQDISLSDIAAGTGYNYHYLSRALNQSVGIGFKQLLNMHRMLYAFRALRDTDLSITEISFESGFQSIRSFNHTCIKMYGCTPRELRRMHRANLKSIAEAKKRV